MPHAHGWIKNLKEIETVCRRLKAGVWFINYYDLGNDPCVTPEEAMKRITAELDNGVILCEKITSLLTKARWALLNPSGCRLGSR
jgi:hypothetical protein